MTCAQGLLRLLWGGGGARSWSATGLVKGLVYVPPLPTSVDDLKTRITGALKTIDPDMLVRVWQEMEYRFDVCLVTKGSYIEHL